MFIKNYSKLATTKQRKQMLSILETGLTASHPKTFLKNKIYVNKNKLKIINKTYDLSKYNNVYLIGFGKMAVSTAEELEKIVPIKQGLIIDTISKKLKKTKVLKGTHPFPSQTNINNTKKLISFVKKLNKNDLLLVIVSGGGSSLLFYPTISLKEYSTKLKKVIFSGIDIEKLNKFRKKYSKIKAGKLAKLIPCKFINLYFSDVSKNKLNIISSGPTFTKKADNILLLDNKTALKAMQSKAKSLGYKTTIIIPTKKQNARTYGNLLLKKLKDKPKHCILSGCETIVKVKGKGKGGRSQELCLSSLKTIKNSTLTSVDSDGIDGTTNVAGAIIDNQTNNIAKKKKLDQDKHLNNNNAYDFLKQTNSLIKTGKTGINVMDFVVVVSE